jgi:hypothetical protein
VGSEELVVGLKVVVVVTLGDSRRSPNGTSSGSMLCG